MGVVGGGVLAVGVALIAFVVFGPVRRRLRQVQDATERLGQGDLHARAPEYGGDEVAAVARSFNRMAAELAARADALQASDRARRQLLADVSHELNTPLTAMRGYLETLAMPDLAVSTPPRDSVPRHRHGGNASAERIIGDLLDLASKAGALSCGGRPWRCRRCSSASQAARARHAGPQRAARPTSGPARSGRRGTGSPGTGDSEPCRKRAAPYAGRRHHYSVGQRTAESLRLRVSDTGPGIAPKYLSKSSTVLKVDVSRKSADGSGLGLSIVKAIVERHGGTITARNENGAVFEILLPAKPV